MHKYLENKILAKKSQKIRKTDQLYAYYNIFTTTVLHSKSSRQRFGYFQKRV